MENSQQQTTLSTSTEERFISMDMLRGFAVLGILIMNIQGYSMISAAYLNPTAYGDFTGINKWIWILSHLFADTKFMTLFSMLFGAGIILFTRRMQLKQLSPLKKHYRRILWLLIFGLVHAYLLWYGDILVAYAVCGLTLVLFRQLKAQWLLVLGLIAITVTSLFYLYTGSSWNYMPPDGQADIIKGWVPTAENIAEELRLYRSGWLDQMQVRIPAAIALQTFIFFINIGWRAGGAMLLGMAFYKWDIITGKKSTRFYITGAILGALIGYPIIITGIIKNFSAEWAVSYSMFLGWQYNYWGSLFVAFAYMCLIMLIFKALQKNIVGKSIIAVGRMAFTNYIMQSIICTFIFYGHGLGLFGHVERFTQIMIVFIVWLLQLIYSPLWLKHFRFGPLEWLWRTLTYGKKQPFKVAKIQNS